jgi:formylglycine-generating enzyme required for sulfatase activity
MLVALAAPSVLSGTLTAAQSREPWRDCADDSCPWLVSLPAGTFKMGAPESEPGFSTEEGPQHPVRVRAFAIGRHEVTFAQWDACVAAGGCPAQPLDEGWGRGQRPAIHIKWDMAQQYVQWLSRKTGKRYRLPSEAEWEYAVRAGTTTPFGLGERVNPDQVNMAGGFTYNGSSKGIDRQRTVPVGSLPANPWGLHEVHGNVWEWVLDCWHEDYRGAPTNGSAWIKGCSQQDRHVLRGGGWYDTAKFARSAFRSGIEVGSSSSLGLRVVRELN